MTSYKNSLFYIKIYNITYRNRTTTVHEENENQFKYNSQNVRCITCCTDMSLLPLSPNYTNYYIHNAQVNPNCKHYTNISMYLIHQTLYDI